MLALQLEHRTGTLTVALGANGDVAISLRNGALAFATEVTKGQRFCDRVVAGGILSAEEVAQASGKAVSVAHVEAPLALCRAAVELGLLTPATAAALLQRESHDALVWTLRALEPVWSFEDTPAHVAPLDPAALGVRALAVEAQLLEALRQAPSAELVDSAGRHFDGQLTLTSPAAEVAARFALSKPELAFLEEVIAGKETVRSLLTKRDPRSGKDALATLAALSITRGVREASVPPSSQRIPAGRASSPAETARSSMATTPDGFSPSAGRGNPDRASSPAVSIRTPTSRASLLVEPSRPSASSSSNPPGRASVPSSQPNMARAAQPSGRPTPTRDLAPASGRPTPTHAHAGSIPPRLSGAPAGSMPPRSSPDGAARVRGGLSPTEVEALVENHLSLALAHGRVGRWSSAMPDIQRALELAPDSSRVLLFHRWASVQVRGGPPTKGDRAELAKLALQTTKADPEFAFGLYVAGDLASMEGDAATAQRLLTRATKLDPNLADAQRLLRIAERQIADEAGRSKLGIFNRKLF